MRRLVSNKMPSLTHLLLLSTNATSPSTRSSEIFLDQLRVEEKLLYHYCYIGTLIDLEVKQPNRISLPKIG